MSRIIALVLLGLALSPPAAAQTLFSNSVGDTCEMWKDNEIRCAWRRTNGSPSKVRVLMTNKGTAPVTMKVGFWRSMCGLPGERGKEETLTIAAGAQGIARAGYTSEAGNVCNEAFVWCGRTKCSAVLTVSSEASGGR